MNAEKQIQREIYLNSRALHDTVGFVLIPLELLQSTAGYDRLDLLPSLAVRERNKDTFEKFPELQEFGPLAKVERARVGCLQETKGNFGHGAFLVAGTGDYQASRIVEEAYTIPQDVSMFTRSVRSVGRTLLRNHSDQRSCS